VIEPGLCNGAVSCAKIAQTWPDAVWAPYYAD